MTMLTMVLIHCFVAMFAIFLSFKCYNGFSFWAFLAALFFPYIYIPYKLGTSKDMCGLRSINNNS